MQDVHGYVKKKKTSALARIIGNTNQRYLETKSENLMFGYREAPGKPFVKVFNFSDLLDINEKLTIFDKQLCEWSYGFELRLRDGQMVLYCATEKELLKWTKAFKTILLINKGKFSPVKEKPVEVKVEPIRLETDGRSKSTPPQKPPSPKINKEEEEERLRLEEERKRFLAEFQQLKEDLDPSIYYNAKIPSEEHSNQTKGSHSQGKGFTSLKIPQHSEKERKRKIYITTSSGGLNTSMNNNRATPVNLDYIKTESVESLPVETPVVPTKNDSSLLAALKQEARMYTNLRQTSRDNLAKTLIDDLDKKKAIAVDEEDSSSQGAHSPAVSVNKIRTAEPEIRQGEKVDDWNYYDQDHRVVKQEPQTVGKTQQRPLSDSKILRATEKVQNINLNQNVIDTSDNIKKLVQNDAFLIPSQQNEELPERKFGDAQQMRGPGFSELKEFIADDDYYKTLVKKQTSTVFVRKSELMKSVVSVDNKLKGKFEIVEKKPQNETFKIIYDKTEVTKPQVSKSYVQTKVKPSNDQTHKSKMDLVKTSIKSDLSFKNEGPLSEPHVKEKGKNEMILHEADNKSHSPFEAVAKKDKSVSVLTKIPTLEEEMNDLAQRPMKSKRTQNIMKQTNDQSKIFQSESKFWDKFKESPPSQTITNNIEDDISKQGSNGFNTKDPPPDNNIMDYSFREENNIFIVEGPKLIEFPFKRNSSLQLHRPETHLTEKALGRATFENNTGLVMVSEEEEIVCYYKEYVHEKNNGGGEVNFTLKD